MAKPPHQTPEARIRALATQVSRQGFHTHPGIPSDPATISGSRGDVDAILEQLLTALAANGQIIDETTG